MPTIDRQKVLHYLVDHWGNYVNNYLSMDVAERLEFMRRQGYRRFADLLAHFSAWWELGMRTIDNYRSDPEFKPPVVDVNAFNAAAVVSVRDLSEVQVIRAFEENREKFIDLVNRLTDDDLRDPRIIKQLEIELIHHLAEHTIKNDPAP